MLFGGMEARMGARSSAWLSVLVADNINVTALSRRQGNAVRLASSPCYRS